MKENTDNKKNNNQLSFQRLKNLQKLIKNEAVLRELCKIYNQ